MSSSHVSLHIERPVTRLQSEETFAISFRKNPLALVILRTADGRCVDTNEAFEQLTGWTRDEVMERAAGDLGIWTWPGQPDGLDRLMSRDTLRNAEIAIRTKSGLLRTTSTSTSRLDIQGEACILAAAMDITDFKRADEIRSRYAAIVTSSHDAIISKDLDGVISAWNAAAELMFGYTEQEAIGQSITMVVPPDLLREEKDIGRRIRAGERIDNFETVRIDKAGRRFDVSLTISPLRDAGGRITGCSKIARNITKTKAAAAALRLSERRLAREVHGAKTLQSISTRLISESTPASLYEQLIGAGMELMASDFASIQMLTADDSSLLLLGSRNFHPDSAAFWQRVSAHAGSTCGKALADNARVLVPDVETCDFMIGTQDLEECRRCGIRAVQSTPLCSRAGRSLGMFSTHWRMPHTPTEEDFRLFDVLARQASDLIERTLAEDALRESEERFRLIANTAPVMIWMTGPDLQITYYNQMWLDFTAQTFDAVGGDGWTHVVHPDDLELCVGAFTTAVVKREPIQVEFRLRRQDDEYRWVLSVGVPRYNGDGSFAGYIGTATDITERKLAQDALSTVSQKLIQAHEDESARIARELHDEIGQRLMVVSMNLSRVRQTAAQSNAVVDELVTAAIQEVRGLAHDIHAISHGLHSSRLEVLGLVGAAAAFCQELSTRQNMQIDVHFENIPFAVPPAISLCLYRVLQEALQNVIRHSASTHATVALESHSDTISLTVTDAGVGFDYQKVMTTPGLGLTSMNERVKMTDGQLTIESQPGRGTKIRAVLPLPR